MNPKDSPFTSAWIISTFYFLLLIEKIFLNEKIFLKHIIFFSLSTAFLLSIRISGFLIFLQYLVGSLILLNINKKFFKNLFQIFIFSGVIIIFLFYLFYPVFWKNPFDVFYALKYMSSHYNDVCTYVFGKCIKASQIDLTYIPVWLILKLPEISILGLFTFFFVEKKIFKDDKKLLFIGTIFYSTILVLLLLILLKPRLYNEVRHVHFLLTIFFILGLFFFFFFSKKIFQILSFTTIIIFFLDNIKLYPYNYTWYNFSSRLLNVQENFEIDYWGVSSKNLSHEAKKIFNEKKIPELCILGGSYVPEYLYDSTFKCFKSYGHLDSQKRPFLVIQNLKNLYKNPKDCSLLFEEKTSLFFYNKKLVVGKIWFCS